MTASHSEWEEQAGAFVLGALPPGQDYAYRAHLSICSACREAVEVLRPVAAALPALPAGQVPDLDHAHPPPGLLDDILARVGTDAQAVQPRRPEVRPILIRQGGSRASAAAGLGLAIAAVGFVAAALISQRSDGAPPPVAVSPSPSASPFDPLGPRREPITFRSSAVGVRAAGTLVAQAWGTELRLVGTGFAAGRRYSVRLVDGDGKTVGAGSFLGAAGRKITCNVTAALPRGEASSVLVRSATGRIVLRARV